MSHGLQGTFGRVPSFMGEGFLRWLCLSLKFGGKWFSMSSRG
jgi:hypothetical protein